MALTNDEEFELLSLEREKALAQPQNKGGSPSLEDKISNRPSSIADLTKNPTSMQHPLGAILRTIGGAAELYQGIPASVAYDLQQGKPQDILNNISKVATGQRPIQYGDVFRGSGVPEPLSAGAGLYTDTVLSPGGAQAIEGTVNIAKSGIQALKGIMKYDNALKQAEKAKEAIDLVRTNLGKAKDLALSDVKDIPSKLNLGKNVSDKVIKAIDNPIYGIEKDSSVLLKQTVGNADKVKSALNDLLTRRDFVEAGNMEKQQIKLLAKNVKDNMISATNNVNKPELGKALSDYHDFMDNYVQINDHLVDKYGNAMGNKLKKTFELLSEQSTKDAWKNVSNYSPELKSIMGSMQRREIFKNLLKTVGAYEVGKKAITGNF